jgi:hypothetical protein
MPPLLWDPRGRPVGSGALRCLLAGRSPPGHSITPSRDQPSCTHLGSPLLQTLTLNGKVKRREISPIENCVARPRYIETLLRILERSPPQSPAVEAKNGLFMSRAIFSPAILSQIRSMVAQGMSPAEIANEIGCTLGTLRVKCSMSGISLRRRRWNPSAGAWNDNIPKRLWFSLSDEIAVRFQQQAAERGMTVTKFAAELLEAVVRDNLYDAVIDSDIKADHNIRLSRRAAHRPKRTSRSK